MFIANPKHVDIAIKQRRLETNKIYIYIYIKASNGYHKQHHKKKKHHIIYYLHVSTEFKNV